MVGRTPHPHGVLGERAQARDGLAGVADVNAGARLGGPQRGLRGDAGEHHHEVERRALRAQYHASEPVDLNNVAWLKLAEATDLKGALALAQRGVQARPEEPHVLNTIAAIEAELGQLGEAKQHLAKSVEAKSLARPDDSDLYVQGRILEQLGLVDDAIAIYRQLKPVTSGTFTPEASDLARKRLQALGVKK